MLKLLPALLPAERCVYVADSGRAPYGHRLKEEISRYSNEISRYLIEDCGCKAIVIACNTATAAAAKTLRATYPDIPFVGMEPAVKPAAKATTSGKVGVMATAGTIGSEKYAELLGQFGRDIEVIENPCEGLVALIESGDFSSARLSAKLTSIIQPMLVQGVDTLVLGCTHFPLVADAIAQTAGTSVALIDPAPAVARQLMRVLTETKLLAEPSDPLHQDRFYTLVSSGELDKLREVWEKISDRPASYASRGFGVG